MSIENVIAVDTIDAILSNPDKAHARKVIESIIAERGFLREALEATILDARHYEAERDALKAKIAETEEKNSRLSDLCNTRLELIAKQCDELAQIKSKIDGGITDLRFAMGDDGKRMQYELVEYAANLRNEALEEAEQAVFKSRLELKGYCPQTLDYARIAIRALKDCGK